MKDLFRCINCGRDIALDAIGTRNRNHCPHCLYSKHVDEKIGDRKSRCGGKMAPIALTSREDGELLLVQKCEKCAKISKNRVAGDDDPEKILEIAKNSKGIDVENIKKALWGDDGNSAF